MNSPPRFPHATSVSTSPATPPAHLSSTPTHLAPARATGSTPAHLPRQLPQKGERLGHLLVLLYSLVPSSKDREKIMPQKGTKSTKSRHLPQLTNIKTLRFSSVFW